jgi:competence protein ComGC
MWTLLSSRWTKLILIAPELRFALLRFFRLQQERSGQRGQGIVEYLLVLAVVIGIFLTLARPFIKEFSKKWQATGKQSIFKEDNSGANFYYFPLK